MYSCTCIISPTMNVFLDSIYFAHGSQNSIFINGVLCPLSCSVYTVDNFLQNVHIFHTKKKTSIGLLLGLFVVIFRRFSLVNFVEKFSVFQIISLWSTFIRVFTLIFCPQFFLNSKMFLNLLENLLSIFFPCPWEFCNDCFHLVGFWKLYFDHFQFVDKHSQSMHLGKNGNIFKELEIEICWY